MHFGECLEQPLRGSACWVWNLHWRLWHRWLIVAGVSPSLGGPFGSREPGETLRVVSDGKGEEKDVKRLCVS